MDLNHDVVFYLHGHIAVAKQQRLREYFSNWDKRLAAANLIDQISTPNTMTEKHEKWEPLFTLAEEDNSPWLNAKQVAERLGFKTVQTLYNARNRGTLHNRPIFQMEQGPRGLRIRESRLLEWLALDDQ